MVLPQEVLEHVEELLGVGRAVDSDFAAANTAGAEGPAVGLTGQVEHQVRDGVDEVLADRVAVALPDRADALVRVQEGVRRGAVQTDRVHGAQQVLTIRRRALLLEVSAVQRVHEILLLAPTPTPLEEALRVHRLPLRPDVEVEVDAGLLAEGAEHLLKAPGAGLGAVGVGDEGLVPRAVLEVRGLARILVVAQEGVRIPRHLHGHAHVSIQLMESRHRSLQVALGDESVRSLRARHQVREQPQLTWAVGDGARQQPC
mmetsp:Transcript_63380/g.163063  ORF Transcript_63380/g.163063 Transcript_63380/m.163063 type:complete len:258 (+) Transcript_63380:149-922(+)